MTKPALDELQQRLEQRFPDARLQVSDDSHLHAGHIGSAGGAGHFSVQIVSAAFAGLGRVARHRLVYDAVADWMPHRIHALVVKATTPAESATAIAGAQPAASTAGPPSAPHHPTNQSTGT